MNFLAFSKIPRLSSECIITEKIDGTNTQILLYKTHSTYNGEYLPFILHQYEPCNEFGDRLVLMAGSSTRWITPGESTDNAGFAGWVLSMKDELVKLGEGRHYGEWWGKGIQRGYGLDEKRFSLFNVSKWTDDVRPSCCGVVPTLYTGALSTNTVGITLDYLEQRGSKAAPGFMQPEGIVVYHVAGGYSFKKAIVGDDKPKGSLETA